MKKNIHMSSLIIGFGKSIGELKEEFNRMFPFLRLEIFKTEHAGSYHKTKREPLASSMLLSSLLTEKSDDSIEIIPEMKVKDLERSLQDKFGVQVEVFRRSGNSWLQTTMTDDWTLEKQNEHGREITGLTDAHSEPEDFDLRRDSDH